MITRAHGIRGACAGLIGAGAALAAPLAAFAAETSEAGKESAGGLPQFDFSTWAGQIFWLLLAFGLLYFVLSRSLLPQLGSVIEDRRDKIADDLDEAARLNQQAQDAQAAYEKALADARAKASALAQETRDAVNAEIARETSAVEAELAQRAEHADTRIRASADAALASVRSIAVDAAGEIVGKLAGVSADPVTLGQAVDKASRA